MSTQIKLKHIETGHWHVDVCLALLVTCIPLGMLTFAVCCCRSDNKGNDQGNDKGLSYRVVNNPNKLSDYQVCMDHLWVYV